MPLGLGCCCVEKGLEGEAGGVRCCCWTVGRERRRWDGEVVGSLEGIAGEGRWEKHCLHRWLFCDAIAGLSFCAGRDCQRRERGEGVNVG